MEPAERYRELKQKEEYGKRRVAQAEGRLDQLVQELQKRFDCQTRKEAEEKEKELQERVSELSTIFEGKLDEFEKKWSGVFDDSGGSA